LCTNAQRAEMLNLTLKHNKTHVETVFTVRVQFCNEQVIA